MDGFLIGRVRGISIRLNWSVVVIAGLITWSLADSVLPEWAEGHSETAYWIAGAVSAIAFVAALTAHELGHSIVALREGVEVKGITLWLFGGVAMLGSEPKTPRAALRIAAAGPAVSAALAVVALLIAPVFDGLVQASLLWFAVMNFVLVVFNLLPAFPLDGGRIYQAWQWQRTGDEVDATERAAAKGLAIGAVLVGIGFIEVMIGSVVGGVWMMLIGWFVREAARAEMRHMAVDRPLGLVSVREVMTPDPATVAAATTMDDFVSGVFSTGRHAAYPVTTPSGDVTGMITLNDVRKLRRGDSARPTVGDVARPMDDVVVVAPSDSVSELLRKMAARSDSRALVFERDDLVGIVSPSDVARLVAVIELAPPMPPPPPEPRPVPSDGQ
ncbi:MAG: site-2 protease family protein [Acidimicrobiia bacterium]|nr:site-2 protease family protein [Acidimicrobiia bacterium]